MFSVFIFFFTVFKNILRIPLITRNTRLILALAIPTDAWITVANEQIEVLLLAPEKVRKVLSA